MTLNVNKSNENQRFSFNVKYNHSDLSSVNHSQVGPIPSVASSVTHSQAQNAGEDDAYDKNIDRSDTLESKHPAKVQFVELLKVSEDSRARRRHSTFDNPLLSLPTQPKPDEDTVVIESPYAIAKERSKKMQLFDKRVPEAWYSRYLKILPHHERKAIQPSFEIMQRDYDLALGRHLGYDHPCLIREDLYESGDCDLIRWKVYQRQQREIELKEMEKRRQELVQERENTKFFSKFNPKLNDMRSTALLWWTMRERAVAFDTIDAFAVYRGQKRFHKLLARATHTKRENKQWARLRQLEARKIFVEMDRREKMLIKFLKLIKSIVWINLFCGFVLRRVRGPYTILKEIKSNLEQLSVDTPHFMTSKYTKAFNLPSYVLETLGKPWRSRKQNEVREVIEHLQGVEAYIKMPPQFQEYIARVGWIISLPESSVVLRQGQRPEYFYIILSGSVKLHHLVGSPVVGELCDDQPIKTYSRYQMFGEEGLTRLRQVREYTAQATSETCLLAIPFQDYQLVSIDTSWDDVEPPHITLTRTVLHLSDFPVTKKTLCIQENIVLHYFVTGSILATSAQESDWVFIVSSGKVYSLSVLESEIIAHIYDEEDAKKGLEKPKEKNEPTIKDEFRSALKRLKETSSVQPVLNETFHLRQQTKAVIKQSKQVWNSLSVKAQKEVLDKNIPWDIRELGEFQLSAKTHDDFSNDTLSSGQRLSELLENKRSLASEESREEKRMEIFPATKELDKHEQNKGHGSVVNKKRGQQKKSKDLSQHRNSVMRVKCRAHNDHIGERLTEIIYKRGSQTSASSRGVSIGCRNITKDYDAETQQFDQLLAFANRNNSSLQYDDNSQENKSFVSQQDCIKDGNEQSFKKSHERIKNSDHLPPVTRSSSFKGTHKNLKVSMKPKIKSREIDKKSNSGLRTSTSVGFDPRGQLDRIGPSITEQVSSPASKKTPASAISSLSLPPINSPICLSPRSKDTNNSASISKSKIRNLSKSKVEFQSKRSTSRLASANSSAHTFYIPERFMRSSGSTLSQSKSSGHSSINAPSKPVRKLLAMYERGSSVGFEWLDMGDGKYRQPNEDYSLVSGGASVIMVKKEALLKVYKQEFIEIPNILEDIQKESEKKLV